MISEIVLWNEQGLHSLKSIVSQVKSSKICNLW
jgi:hypothetical protein